MPTRRLSRLSEMDFIKHMLVMGQLMDDWDLLGEHRLVEQEEGSVFNSQ